MDSSLKQAVAELLNVDCSELVSSKRLQDIEAWDSVNVLSVMVLLSESLGKEIPVDEMTSLRTFGDIESLVAASAAG